MRYAVGSPWHTCCHRSAVVDTTQRDAKNPDVPLVIGEFPDREVAERVCRLLNEKELN